MACSSCAKKASARNQRMSQSFKSNPKRLTRLLREAERKNDIKTVEELKKKLNNNG